MKWKRCNKNMNNRLGNVIRGVATGVINKFVAIIFPLLIRMVFVKTIGIKYLGLNGLFGSILGVLGITELGVSSAIVYSLYRPLADNDITRVNALLKLLRKIYNYVGIIICVISLALVPFLHYLVADTSEVDINLRVLYLVFLFNTVIGYFLYSYKVSLLIALQRTDINNIVSTVILLAEYVLQVFVLIMIGNYYIFVIIMPVATICNNLIVSYYVNKQYPQYHCEGKLERSEVKEIFKKVGALAGNKINGTLVNSADNLVLSAFLGVTVVALYQNYYTVIGALVAFMALLFDSLRPSIGNSLVTENTEKNYKDYNSITMIVAWIAGWCSICLLCLFQSFISFYYGKDYLLNLSTVILLAFYFYIWKILDVQVLYRDAAGLWWTDRFRPYIVSVCNLVTNILLVKTIGINGVIISTVGTQLVISLPWLITSLNKEYFNERISKYLFNQVYYFVAIFTYFVCHFLITRSDLAGFCMKMLACCVIPNIIIFLFFRRKEEFKKVQIIASEFLYQKKD